MDKQDLLELKEDIEKAKDEVNRLEGREEHLLQELEKEWKCSTVEEAEKKMKEFGKEIEKLKKKIDKGVKNLEEKYDFE